MIQPLIDRFCDSPRRWLIVTGVTFVLGLVTLLPQVDYYFSLRQEHQETQAQLATASTAAEELPAFENRVVQQEGQLIALQQRTFAEGRLSEFRNELIELVRSSGCQVRRINAGEPQTRPWTQNDSPTVASADKNAKPTPFALETRSIHLSVAGSMQSVINLLDGVEATGMMFNTKSLELRPTGSDRHGVEMDLQLNCYALTQPKKA